MLLLSIQRSSCIYIWILRRLIAWKRCVVMQLPDTSFSHNVSTITFSWLLRNFDVIKNSITVSVCAYLVRMENAFCINIALMLWCVQKSRFLRWKQVLDAVTSSSHSLGRFLFLIYLLVSSFFRCIVCFYLLCDWDLWWNFIWKLVAYSFQQIVCSANLQVTLLYHTCAAALNRICWILWCILRSRDIWFVLKQFLIVWILDWQSSGRCWLPQRWWLFVLFHINSSLPCFLHLFGYRCAVSR